MQPEVAKHFLDALQACEAVAQFTRGKNIEQYCNDLMLRSAVERQFEILGEAFARLDKIDSTYRDQCSEIGKVIGMRNRIIHGYDSVDDTIVWDAVSNHLPSLLIWLKSLTL